ncbi:MAG: SDR family NAD(P)-dependent oxidoreductase [Solirubrobacteraceae bacterium]
MSLAAGRVLLTGASGGIGHAIARALAAPGAELILTGRRVEVLEPLASELGARSIVCDLSKRDQLQRLITEVGEVDVLVANAALPASGSLAELTPAQIDAILDVNLRAPIMLARELSHGMIERRRGHLVFISSLAGKTASPVSSMYSATKFGLRGFALAIREDLRAANVGVSVVLPGFIRDAGMFADAAVKLPPGFGTSAPDEVARAVIDAIQHNRAEVTVAPILVRFGVTFATLAPQISSTIKRLAGGDKVAGELAARQIDKRP